MIEFSKIIREIDSELKPHWQPGAFAWADKHMNGAHEKAVTRFQDSINQFLAQYKISSASFSVPEFHKDAVNIVQEVFPGTQVLGSEEIDWTSFHKEADVYLESMLKILKEYKKKNPVNEQEDFLETLKPGMRDRPDLDSKFDAYLQSL